jgi:hypothetical protein
MLTAGPVGLAPGKHFPQFLQLFFLGGFGVTHRQVYSIVLDDRYPSEYRQHPS